MIRKVEFSEPEVQAHMITSLAIAVDLALKYLANGSEGRISYDALRELFILMLRKQEEFNDKG